MEKKAKEIKQICEELLGLSREIGFNGFANYSQRDYMEKLLDVRNRLLELE